MNVNSTHRCCLFADLRPRGSCRGKKQYRCAACGKVSTVGAAVRVYSPPTIYWGAGNGGRNIIYLGKKHKFANSGGWQYLYRYRVMLMIGRTLTTSEEVDHIDGDKTNDHPRNLRVLLKANHTKIHSGGDSGDGDSGGSGGGDSGDGNGGSGDNQPPIEVAGWVKGDYGVYVFTEHHISEPNIQPNKLDISNLQRPLYSRYVCIECRCGLYDVVYCTGSTIMLVSGLTLNIDCISHTPHCIGKCKK